MRKVVCLLLCFVTVLTLCSSVAVNSYALTSNMDNTDVLSDLKGATIDGQKFDTFDYPADSKGTVKLLYFAEYCYSQRLSVLPYYGLYIYVYNPQQLDIVESELNKIQIGIEYNQDNEPTKYQKFSLRLLDISDDKLFIKLKVVDTDSIYNRVSSNSDSRRYDISGIELFAKGSTNAVEYTVGGIYTYSGYADGCGDSPSNDNNLQCTISSLDVAVIDDIQHTFYRTWYSSPIIKADQLSSVYFAVDKDIADRFDSLYSIDAEAYRYLTAPIFLLYNKSMNGSGAFINYTKLYNDTLAQVGKDMNGSGVVFEMSTGLRILYYNKDFPNAVNIEKLAWLFQIDNSNSNVSVTSDELLNYMNAYSANRTKDILGKYNSDLFAEDYYLGGKYDGNGYIRINIDNSGDFDFNLVGTTAQNSAWSSLFNKTGQPVSSNIKPIVQVTSQELTAMTDEDISSQFYIDMSDTQKFRAFVKTNELQGKACYLFRFANNTFVRNQLNYDTTFGGKCGDWCQEVVFLDFDIISLGYMKDGVVTNIPTVMSPIDIVGGLPGVPEGGLPWWVWLLIALFILGILCIIFRPIFTIVLFVLKAVWYIISAPFKLIGKLFTRKNKEDKTK